MIETAVYVGPIPHLRGERAIIQRSDPYRRPWFAGDDMVFAQFTNMKAQRRLGRAGYVGRSKRKLLALGWHRFRARDWRADDMWNEPSLRKAQIALEPLRIEIAQALKECPKRGRKTRAQPLLL